MSMSPQRIAIVGPTAAGKTTLSRRMSEMTGLPVFHMDSLLWKENWTKANAAAAQKEHDALIAQDKWIIEGWIDRDFRNRACRADLIIHLDYSAPRLVMNYLSRVRDNTRRHEMAEGCIDRFSPRQLATRMLRWDNRRVHEALVGADQSKIIRLATPQETSAYLSRPPVVMAPEF